MSSTWADMCDEEEEEEVQQRTPRDRLARAERTTLEPTNPWSSVASLPSPMPESPLPDPLGLSDVNEDTDAKPNDKPKKRRSRGGRGHRKAPSTLARVPHDPSPPVLARVGNKRTAVVTAVARERDLLRRCFAAAAHTYAAMSCEESVRRHIALEDSRSTLHERDLTQRARLVINALKIEAPFWLVRSAIRNYLVRRGKVDLDEIPLAGDAEAFKDIPCLAQAMERDTLPEHILTRESDQAGDEQYVLTSFYPAERTTVRPKSTANRMASVITSANVKHS